MVLGAVLGSAISVFALLLSVVGAGVTVLFPALGLMIVFAVRIRLVVAVKSAGPTVVGAPNSVLAERESVRGPWARVQRLPARFQVGQSGWPGRRTLWLHRGLEGRWGLRERGY